MNVLAVVIKSTGLTSPVKLCSLESVGACGSVKEGKFDMHVAVSGIART